MPVEAEQTSASIDEVRDYWNMRPCNIRHSDLPIGSKSYFDAVEKRKYFVEPHIPEFADFESWKGKRVLEIGCGIGTDAVNFARNGAEYVGIELSEKSLELAELRFRVLGLEGRFFVADVEKLSASKIPEGPYDLIYSFGVLHHTPDPAGALSELGRFSGPGGKIKIMLYARNSWKAMLIEYGLDQPEAQDGCPIALTYGQEQARELLRSGGFEVTGMSQDHVFPYQIDEYIKYNYVLEPWFQAMPDALRSGLQKNFGWHLLIDGDFKG